jgi:carboxyl-terminal processing protease
MKRLFLLSSLLTLLLPAHGQLFTEQGFKLVRLFGWIDNYYVDSVNLSRLCDETIRETLHKLDPHSVYYAKGETMDVEESLQGSFDGVDLHFELFRDTFLIVSVAQGSAVQQQGVHAGDQIISIAGESVAGPGIHSKQVHSKLRGTLGSGISIAIKRRGVAGLLTFTIPCQRVSMSSIDASYQVNDSTGYLKLNRFSILTGNEIDSVLRGFKSRHIKNIILDLCDNGGGYVEASTDVVDQFLDDGKMIVYTKGLHSLKKMYFATDKGLYKQCHLVVMMNENSASASEIVAGALQDWDRAVIVGRRSYGKGLVQTKVYFDDGAMARITIARYYTPTGRLIQKAYNKGFDNYSNDLQNRLLHGELQNRDSIHFPDSLQYQTLVRKRVVYGGGGIMPDVFVPADSSDNSSYFRNLRDKGYVQSFATAKEETQNLKNTYPDFETFKNQFVVDGSQVNELVENAKQNGLTCQESEIKKLVPAIALLLKATIARNLYGNSSFYETNNLANACFKQAVEVVNNYNKYLQQ